MELTDIQLMERVREGDKASFETLVVRHQSLLINFFYRLCWRRALSEDLAQDTFLRIYEARQRYQPTSKFRTYLFRVARNLWIDHVRRQSRRGVPVSLDQEVVEGGVLSNLIPAQDRGDDQAQQVMAKMKKVLDAVETLTPAQQELFALVNVEGLKYREISEILDIPVGTVKTRMHSLMKRLRATLVES